MTAKMTPMTTNPGYRALSRDFRTLCHRLAEATTFESLELTLSLCIGMCDRLGHRLSHVSLNNVPSMTYDTPPPAGETEMAQALWWGFAQMMRACTLHVDEVTVVAIRHPNGSVCAAELHDPRCDTFLTPRLRIYSCAQALADLRASLRHARPVL